MKPWSITEVAVCLPVTDLELVGKVVSVQKFISHIVQSMTIPRLADGKHIERPVV